MTQNAAPLELRILAGLDLAGRSEAAFNRAVRLAAGHNAKLSIMHVIDNNLPEKLAGAHAQYAATLMQDHVNRANGSGLHDVTQHIVHGGTCETITSQAEQIHADLIVLGAHRGRGAVADLMGTTVERVLRLSAKPILLVKKQNSLDYQRIIVAVDFSVASRHALEFTLKMFPAAEILAVNTWGWRRKPLEIAAAQSPEQYEAHRFALKGLVRETQEAVGQADHGKRNVVEILEAGLPEVIIPEMASERVADLVVVGTHAKSDLTRFLLGSVAEEIMRRTQTDILAVPPPPTLSQSSVSGQKIPLVA